MKLWYVTAAVAPRKLTERKTRVFRFAILAETQEAAKARVVNRMSVHNVTERDVSAVEETEGMLDMGVYLR